MITYVSIKANKIVITVMLEPILCLGAKLHNSAAYSQIMITINLIINYKPIKTKNLKDKIFEAKQKFLTLQVRLYI